MRDPQSRGMGSIPIRVTDTAKWWNWDTRDVQTVVPARACEFDSRLGYFIADAAGAQLAFIRPVSPARYRDLQLRVGQRPAEPHKFRPPGATPGSATCVTTRYANRQSGHVESVAILWVRRPLWSLKSRSRGPTVKTPGRHPGKCWFDSSRDHF